MPVNRALLLSILTNIALLAMLLGAAGFVNQVVLKESTLPVLTALGSAPGLFIGASLIFITLNKTLLARLCGLCCAAYALLLWFGGLQAVSAQFHQPPDVMIVNLLLVGIYFATFQMHRLSWPQAIVTASFGIVLGCTALAEIWFTDHKLIAANNIFELSIFALMIVLIAIAIVIAHLLSGRTQLSRSAMAWFPALLVQSVAISFWVYLTAAELSDIQQRGILSIQQTGEALDKTIAHNEALLARYAERVVSNREAPHYVLYNDALRLQKDASNIDAISIVQNDNIIWQSPSKSAQNYEHIATPFYQRWLSKIDDGFKITLDRQASLPTALMAAKLTLPETRSFIIFHLDVARSMASTSDSYFDVFTKIVRIGNNTYISDEPDALNSEQSLWLIENSSVVVQRQYQLEVGYPLTIYAVLARPGLISSSVKMHQLILLSGFIFAIVLTFALMSNRRLQILATQDTVTRLFRRPHLEKLLQQAIDSRNASGWVLFIDLDGFKPINDSLGISTGNQVLVAIAERLKQRAPKKSSIARFSSDEFIVFVHRADAFNIDALCQSMLATIREKLTIQGFTLHLTASIGVYAVDRHTHSASEAIQSADVAMTAAKELGGNNYRLFNVDMAKHYQRSLTLRNELQDALDAGELRVFYQPIVAASDGRIVAVEALARWYKADGSVVPPALFIPLAEQTGQIKQLSEWVLLQAMTDLAELSKQHTLTLSVNISAHHFHVSDMPLELQKLASQTGFRLEQLCVEITEGVFIRDLHFINQQLNRLRDQGIKIAIDDFGTGYSSLSYLNTLPVDTLKIDRSFTMHVERAEGHYPLVNSIITLVHSVDKRIVVEGVETQAQAHYFGAAGCQYLQGFGYAKPMPLDELSALLQRSSILNINGYTDGVNQ